jgi:hypothetical protein
MKSNRLSDARRKGHGIRGRNQHLIGEFSNLNMGGAIIDGNEISGELSDHWGFRACDYLTPHALRNDHGRWVRYATLANEQAGCAQAVASFH